MSLRNDHRRNKIIADIAGVEDRLATIEGITAGVFSDLSKLQTFIDSKDFFTAQEKAEIQTIINESYKTLWDQAVSRTPVEIKDTNRV